MTPLSALIADLAQAPAEVDMFHEGFARLARAVPQALPAPALRDRVLAAVEDAARGPVFVQGDSLFARSQQLEFVTIAPGVEIKTLFHDSATNARTAIVRMAANTAFPPHEHHGIEDLYLIAGDAWVGDVPMRAGDYCRAPSGSEHNDVRSGPAGAQALVVTR